MSTIYYCFPADSILDKAASSSALRTERSLQGLDEPIHSANSFAAKHPEN
ncbi:UNVERIFIED_CONTAM: hypothetical protein Slati_2629500 [Sesamum latifolium]|uniref:Uncharacterized protein n=1 Tax=Sesamum latifolium TaxID=2727402 RepID=A0AAW2VUH9_9LAMI